MFPADRMLVAMAAVVLYAAAGDKRAVQFRLNSGTLEEEEDQPTTYGFLEAENVARKKLFRICSQGWKKAHADVACERAGFHGGGYSYHDVVSLAEGPSGSIKGVTITDALRGSFTVRVCDRHVVLFCVNGTIDGNSSSSSDPTDSIFSGVFSSFPMGDSPPVTVCREEDNGLVASLACKKFGFGGGFDNTLLEAREVDNAMTINCSGSSYLDDCRFELAGKRCAVSIFDCFKNVTFVVSSQEVWLALDPLQCTSSVLNLVFRTPPSLAYALHVSLRVGWAVGARRGSGSPLGMLRFDSDCDNATTDLSTATYRKFLLQNCSRVVFSLITSPNSEESICASLDQKRIVFGIWVSDEDPSFRYASEHDHFFKTNAGLVLFTLIIVSLVFFVIIFLVDWRVLLPKKRKRMPRAPPPSLADLSDQQEKLPEVELD